MRTLDDGIEAELFGAPDQLQIIRQPSAHILALRMLATYDKTKFHSLSPLLCRTLETRRLPRLIWISRGKGGGREKCQYRHDRIHPGRYKRKDRGGTRQNQRCEGGCPHPGDALIYRDKQPAFANTP
jgi:hypothetical protein